MRLFSGVVFALLLGCQQQNRVYHKPYFDIDSLVNEQIKQLVTRKASLDKRANVGLQNDQRQWQPDSAQWVREFEVFRQLDAMNRPGFKNTYTKTVTRDAQSNLLVAEYTATRPAPVTWLKVFYLNHPGNIRKVEAHYQESNTLFVSERTLTWELDDIGRQLLLNHYRLQGFQKMVSSDSVVYRIESTITN